MISSSLISWKKSLRFCKLLWIEVSILNSSKETYPKITISHRTSSLFADFQPSSTRKSSTTTNSSMKSMKHLSAGTIKENSYKNFKRIQTTCLPNTMFKIRLEVIRKSVLEKCSYILQARYLTDWSIKWRLGHQRYLLFRKNITRKTYPYQERRLYYSLS